MYNKKRSTSFVRDPSVEASLVRMDPVMPVPNQSWRSFPMDRQKETLNQNLENFWACQRDEIKNLTGSPVRNPLPLARIKKVMKSDPKVKMTRSDTPVLLAKASELFIMELTLRAWMHAQSCYSQTIRGCDIAEAVRSSKLHSYLADHVNFEKRSTRDQAVRERTHKTEHKERLPPADGNVPGTKAATDIDQIQQAVPERADLPTLIDIDQIQQHIYPSHDSLNADHFIEVDE